MREACREAKQGNASLKESVCHMANKFLNAVESPEMEACYNVLQLPITQSSIKKEYISTCPENECVFIAKSDNILRKMDPNSEDV